MVSIAIYVAAGLAEIAGCFAFWAWLKLDHSPLWLALFAYLLTWIDSAAAGRAYAAYGGIYIALSILWLWIVEGARPDRWDFVGAAICIAGASVILFAPRG